jgi:hypothetical protein
MRTHLYCAQDVDFCATLAHHESLALSGHVFDDLWPPNFGIFDRIFLAIALS